VRSEPQKKLLDSILHIFNLELKDEIGEPNVKPSESASKLARQGPLD